MSTLTNKGQQYVAERAWRGGSAIASLFLGLTNAALSKTSVLSDAYGGEALGIISAPTALTAVLAGVGTGNLANGVYKYKVTFVGTNGETEAGTASAPVTVTDWSVDGQLSLSAIPVGPTGVSARKIYRTLAGGSDYYLVTTLNDNSTATYVDNIADGSLTTAAPSTNTTGQKSAPAAPNAVLAGAGAGNLGTGTYQYKVTFVTASGETEGSASGSVAVTTPGSDGQVNVTFTTGPTGVTGRKIYRTLVGGSTFKLLTTVADNTTTLYLDNIADGSLGATLAESNTTAPNGYFRKIISQDTVGFPSSALDSGDWALITKSFVWTGSNGIIGPVTKVFLTDAVAGSTGNLYAFWDFQTSHQLDDGESVTWAGKLKQK